MSNEAAALGVREVKNNFSALGTRINSTGEPLTVLKNGHPWLVIMPASKETRKRQERKRHYERLKALIEESDVPDPDWSNGVTDNALLEAERMRRFG